MCTYWKKHGVPCCFMPAVMETINIQGVHPKENKKKANYAGHCFSYTIVFV